MSNTADDHRISEAELEIDRESVVTSTVVEIEIPGDDFVLGETETRLGAVNVEVEPAVAHDGARFTPHVWIGSTEREALEGALADDSSVETFELLADLDDGWLYRMEWADRVRALVELLTDEQGTILDAASAEGWWHLRLVVPERGTIARAHDVCERTGVTINLDRIYDLDDGRQGHYGLTDRQRTTLAVAAERGYYEIPRATTAEDLAAELGVSHQSVSERLRRAHKNLVENTIVAGDGSDADGGPRTQQRRERGGPL